MQRRSSKILVMLLALAVVFSTVAAAPAEKKTLTLIEARYVQGAGIVILFDSTGLTGNDIQGGTAFVHSIAYEMSCGFKDQTDVVRCLIPTSLSRYAGETFRAVLAGFVFWPIMPGPKAGPLKCEADESLWYTINIYVDGVWEDSDRISAELYEWLLELMEDYPEEFDGITIEIADRFCGPLVIIEPSS